MSSKVKAFFKSETKERDQSDDVDSITGQVVPLDKNEKQLGIFSAVGLIFNRMVGTGIFSTTSTIYNLSGSVGLSLVLWVVGSVIALAGMYVYMEFGSGIPKNGGEKNYLEYVFKKPKFLVSAMYASYIFFLGWASGNSIVFGQYILTAADVEVGRWNQRGIGCACLVFAFLIHSINVKAGVYLQNVLGIFKLVIILLISITGLVGLGGHISAAPGTKNFHNAFSGGEVTGYGVVMALYNIIWSFIGYSNVNYALGEVKNPVRTLKISGPTAVIALAIIYMLVNIAYFAVVPLDILSTSGTIVAGNFFEIAFGGESKRAISVFVALSALGNVMSVIFSQGRIIQQLARENVLPFSSFFATQRPFGTPLVGLLQHLIVCIVTVLAPPPGDAYNFIMNLISYPLNIVNFFVGSALIYLNVQALRGKLTWNPPIKASIPVSVFFTLSSAYLVIAPYIAPSAGQSVYESLPYWLHCVVGVGIFAFGGLYWLVWAVVLPKLGGYYLYPHAELDEEDGFWRTAIIKIKNGDAPPNEITENEINIDTYSSDEFPNGESTSKA